MIRSGQMLLATALQCHLLGRGRQCTACVGLSHVVDLSSEWRVSTSSVSDMSVHKQVTLECRDVWLGSHR